MKCYKCGSELSSLDYCNKCGAEVGAYKKIIVMSNTYYNTVSYTHLTLPTTSRV